MHTFLCFYLVNHLHANSITVLMDTEIKESSNLSFFLLIITSLCQIVFVWWAESINFGTCLLGMLSLFC